MIWLLFVSFVASLSYSILIESIPSCDELSQICIVSQNGKYQLIIPHYLLTCYSSSEKETLQDLLSDRTVDISEFQSIDFLQHHFFDLHGLSPHVIVLRCLPPFSSVLLPVQLPNTPIHLQNYRVLMRTSCDSRFVVARMSDLSNQTQMQLSFNIPLLQTLHTRILLTLCSPLVSFSSLFSPLSISYSTFFL